MKGLTILLFALAAHASVVDIIKTDERDNVDWWENGVFYQIYPRSFKDSNNDGTGDIKGVTSKLQHLKDLGVTGTWLSPIFDSPMVDGGYDIRNYTKVNSIYGTNDDLVELFTEAKKLGLKIILDFVPNHSSNQHQWFINSANRVPGYEDYYIWRDCPVQNGQRRLPNNWIAVFNTPMWSYDPRRNQCYLHQFTKEQPDINFRMENGKTKQEMLDVLTYWMDQGADGFRVDAINHMFESPAFTNQALAEEGLDPNLYNSYDNRYTRDLRESYEFIYSAREHLDNYAKANGNLTRVLMTEAYASIEQQTRWYGVNDTLRGSHIPFNFGFIADITASSKAEDFKKVVDEWMSNMPSFTMGQANWVLGNHDRSRLRSRYGDERYEGLAIVSMTLPGVAVVYYGEEIGMKDNNDITWEETEDPQACQSNSSIYKQFTRDPVRTPMQWDDTPLGGFCESCKTWLPVHPSYKDINVKKQTGDEQSTFALYKNLIALRKEKEVLKFGGLETKVVGGGDVFAFERTMAGKSTIVTLLNLSKDEKTVNLADLLHPDDFTGKTKATVLISNNNSKLKKSESFSNLNSLTIGGYDGVVFEVSGAMRVATSALYVLAAFWVVVKYVL
ncbi:maltase 2-like [Chironomus tepperi]|uniref:maltase 2-like n=1 Tax=Chironomus tepperi TaxID=113505 RepID=UPI00391F50DA